MVKLLGRLVQLAVIYVTVQAVREQLSRPPEQRTWRGKVGPVPYDFRIPTLDDIKAAYWNPDSDRLFTDRVLGVGWGINFAQLVKIANEFRQQTGSMGAQ